MCLWSVYWVYLLRHHSPRSRGPKVLRLFYQQHYENVHMCLLRRFYYDCDSDLCHFYLKVCATST